MRVAPLHIVRAIASATFAAAIALTATSCTRGVPPDPNIVAALRDAARRCEINPGNAYFTRCSGDTETALNRALQEAAPETALASLSSALALGDKATRAAAFRVMYRRFRYARQLEPFRREPTRIPVNAVEDLIRAVGKSDAQEARFILPSAVHLAMLRGYQVDLLDMLDAHRERRVRLEAMPLLMTYGRLRAFFKIKLLVSRPPRDLARAAASAPLNMYNYGPEEIQVVCPWASGLLRGPDDYIASRAGAILAVRCGGAFRDFFLKEAARRAKAGSLRPPFSLALTEFPLSCASVFKDIHTATKAQCAEAKRLIKLIR